MVSRAGTGAAAFGMARMMPPPPTVRVTSPDLNVRRTCLDQSIKGRQRDADGVSGSEGRQGVVAWVRSAGATLALVLLGIVGVSVVVPTAGRSNSASELAPYRSPAFDYTIDRLSTWTTTGATASWP